MTFVFDAVCLVSYGGPRGPHDVLPFLRNAARGRGIPDERLLAVSGHYALYGGVSPINARNAELVDALGAALSERGIEVPIVVGNRNWTPFLRDALAGLAASGHRRVLCLATAAYASYSGCRQYREDLAGAAEGLDLELTKVGPFAETEGFVEANADAVRAALSGLSGTPRILFVTHAIPAAMDAASGPVGPSEQRRDTYTAQHARVAARIAAASGLPEGSWEIAYCSRSGPAHVPWLGPDVNDRLAELAADGVDAAVVVPFGFINDHMEVVHDLDTEARATAENLGLEYVRAATVGVHPAFVAMVADTIAAWHPGQHGQVGGLTSCGAQCCLSGRPGAPRPASCSSS